MFPPSLMYDGHHTLWAVSMGDSSDLYMLHIVELVGSWQRVELPWRRRWYPHVVGCWGGYIIQFGAEQQENRETIEVLDTHGSRYHITWASTMPAQQLHRLCCLSDITTNTTVNLHPSTILQLSQNY